MRDLWKKLCCYENLFLAYKKARKHKTTKQYVIDFEKNLKDNLLLLQTELLLHSYEPKPLVHFVIHDPKTRKISKSAFRDRIVHHAPCNVIESVFEKSFIYDSYANRKGKGALKAVERFNCFKKKVSRNNTVACYVLKADIRKYFENVNHSVLLSIIKQKISDKRVLWLVKKILRTAEQDKGMPLGNLTSQFFANVYLNELDAFVKHKLRAKHYIRYVDDFVVLHTDKAVLQEYKTAVSIFLEQKLALELHPDKSKIIPLKRGIGFLGFRIFYYHALLKKSNLRKMSMQLSILKNMYDAKTADYDTVYNFFEGWLAYACYASTYHLRKTLASRFQSEFASECSAKEISRYVNLYQYFPSTTTCFVNEACI